MDNYLSDAAPPYVLGVLAMVVFILIIEYRTSDPPGLRTFGEIQIVLSLRTLRRIQMVLMGLLTGFTFAFLLKYLSILRQESDPYLHHDTNILNTIADSNALLFAVIVIVAMVGAGGAVYTIDREFEIRNRAIWLRFVVACAVGFIGSMLGCILIPLAIYFLIHTPGKDLVSFFRKDDDG